MKGVGQDVGVPNFMMHRDRIASLVEMVVLNV